MVNAGLQSVVDRLRRGLGERATDGELLERFVASRDQEAFAQLVARHGPKVFAVCQRILGQHQLAEDAYQATFVVLARRADAIRPPSAVGGFLFGVARKAALKALAMNHRRKEASVDRLPDSTAFEPVAADSDLLAMLDEEIAKLSDALRAAVVLCELDGVGRAEAARQLGIAEGTLSSRLAAARKQLATRLKARGAAFTVGLFASLVASATSVGPPTPVAATTSIEMIAGGVMRTLFLAKLKVAALLCATVATIVGFGGIGTKPGPEANAAPVPKPLQSEAGFIWTYNYKTGDLIAYSPAGTVEKTLQLQDRRQLLGLTPDGQKIAFVGLRGKLVQPGAGPALNVHLRDIGDATVGTDTGIEYRLGDQFHWSHDGKRVLRTRPTEVLLAGVPDYPAFDHKLYDLETKTELPLAIGLYQQALGWSPDDRWLLLAQYSDTVKIGNITNFRTTLHRYDVEKKSSNAFGKDWHVVNPALSPDGRAVFGLGYNRNEPEPLKASLVNLDVETGRATKFEFPAGRGHAGGRWSPSGKRLAYIRTDPTNPKEVTLNFCNVDGSNTRSVSISTPDRGQPEVGILGWFKAPTGDTKIDPEAVKLVAKLGSADFAEREAAEKKLRELAGRAVGAVRAGLQSDDPEIARRCEKLLPQVMRAELLLPDHRAWKRFAAIVGTGIPGRDLYEEMLAKPHRVQLVFEAEENLNRAAEIYGAELKLRVDTISAGQREAERRNAAFSGLNLPDRGILTPGEYVALLFLGTYPGTGGVSYAEKDEHDRVCHHNLFSLSVPKALKEFDSATSPPIRRLFAAWLAARDRAKPLEIGLGQVLGIGIAEALPAARRVAADVRHAPKVRGLALLTVGQLSTAADGPLLEAALGDTRTFHKTNYTGSGGRKIALETLVGDAAAASLLKLFGGHPADFGHPVYGLVNDRPAEFLRRYEYLGFATVGERIGTRKKLDVFLKGKLPPRPIPSADAVKAAFLKVAGDSPAAVALYRRVVADAHRMAVLAEAVRYPHRAGELYASELWRVWENAIDPMRNDAGVPAEDAAVGFFLGADPATADALRVFPESPKAKDGYRTHETMLLSTAVNIEVYTNKKPEAFDRLVAAWTAARADPWVRGNGLEVARTYRLNAMVPVARRIATDADVEPRFRAAATTLLADLGGQSERDVLVTLLEDKSECESRSLSIKGERAPTATRQIRDLALGCLLVLDGAKVGDFGFDEFDFWKPDYQTSAEYFRLAPFGFFNEANRKAAHEKGLARLKIAAKP